MLIPFVHAPQISLEPLQDLQYGAQAASSLSVSSESPARRMAAAPGVDGLDDLLQWWTTAFRSAAEQST